MSDNPRNPKNAPDAFETEAIGEFRSNTNLGEYYSFGTMNDESYYRYSVPLKMQSACAECHGDPVGEIDVTGFPKEGLQSGDLVGIASISIPAKPYEDNLLEQILLRSLLSFAVLAACLHHYPARNETARYQTAGSHRKRRAEHRRRQSGNPN